MELEVRTFQLGRTSWSQDVIEAYVKKISPFEKLSFRILKNEKKALQGINGQDRVWACDERGRSFSSKAFSQEISKMRDGGIKKLVFYIGGPFGLPAEVRERANQVFTLSPFVMSQEVALVVLQEQIFRAYTIIHNHPYHNE